MLRLLPAGVFCRGGFELTEKPPPYHGARHNRSLRFALDTGRSTRSERSINPLRTGREFRSAPWRVVPPQPEPPPARPLVPFGNLPIHPRHHVGRGAADELGRLPKGTSGLAGGGSGCGGTTRQGADRNSRPVRRGLMDLWDRGRASGIERKSQRPVVACAVIRRRFPVGANPTRLTAPAGSNRSSHGGNEMAEAFG